MLKEGFKFTNSAGSSVIISRLVHNEAICVSDSWGNSFRYSISGILKLIDKGIYKTNDSLELNYEIY